MELLLLYAPRLLLVLSSLYLLGLLADSRRNLPPGPRPLPLVGNLLCVGALPHRSLARLAERHGPVMALRLGSVTTVVASSADAARDFLPPAPRRRLLGPLRPRRRLRAGAPQALHGLAPGEQPPLARAPQGLLRGALCAAPPRRRRAPVHRPGEGAAARLPRGAAGARGRARPLRPPGLHDRAEHALLHHLLRRLADLDDDRVAPSEFESLLAELNMTIGLPNVSDFFPQVAWLDPQGLRRRIQRLFERMHAMIDELIERRLWERTAGEGEPSKTNFLDVLLDCGGAQDGRGFDRQTLLSLLVDLFSAGTSTSAVTVEWVIAELLLNPSSMAKARDELAQVIGSKPEIEESDIGQLKYLQAIVKETFRLHPPAPFLLPHQAETTTTQIRGYTVPGAQGDRA